MKARGMHKNEAVLVELVEDLDSGGFFLLVTYPGISRASDFWYSERESAFAAAGHLFGVQKDDWFDED